MTRKPYGLLLGVWLTAAGVAAAAQLPLDFGPIDNPDYLRECGACHLAFPPQLLPARSWRRLMGSLGEHFGETAEMTEALRTQLAGYLDEHAADEAANRRAQRVVASLSDDATPARITEVPYIKGVHAAVLDPLYGGVPRPSHLSQCAVCHIAAGTGNFTTRRYSASDRLYAGDRLSSKP